MAKYTAKPVDSTGKIPFTEEEHGTWKLLIERQEKIIQGRACDEYIAGVKKLNFPHDRIPDIAEVSAGLSCTGWAVEPVAAIIPLKSFFELIANRHFPVATFIRVREELDYIKEPDIFHEYFGHCPLLTLPFYADFVQWYGKFALTMPEKLLPILGRLFWFTIEFGLIESPQGLRIMGGGILSSFAETQHCLENSKVERVPFDLATVLGTDYNYWEIQKRYYVLRDFRQLVDLQNEVLLRAALATASPGKDPNMFRTC